MTEQERPVHHCQEGSLVWVRLDPDDRTWRLNHDALGTIVEYCPFCGKKLLAAEDPRGC